MNRWIIRGSWLAAVLGACLLQGRTKSASDSPDRSLHAVQGQVAGVDQPAQSLRPQTRANNTFVTPTTSAFAITPTEQESEELPAWLTALLQHANPNVRLQGLEAWSQHPGLPLNAATYALVDPDERVRTRAQELFERKLAPR